LTIFSIDQPYLVSLESNSFGPGVYGQTDKWIHMMKKKMHYKEKASDETNTLHMP
jgi:proteasome assembly chaperone (PAC2) family protein